MNFDFLIDPRQTEGHPLKILGVSFLYTIIAVLISTAVGGSYSSMLMVLFAVATLIPVFYNVIGYEAQQTETITKELTLLEQHSKAILFLIMMFLGSTLAFSLWFLVGPSPDTTFASQIQTITEINAITGNVIGDITHANALFFKNFRLLILTILLSTVFGVGVILIFSWNASVIAVAIGQYIQGIGGLTIKNIGLGLGRYLIHGVPEMASYFIAGLAGAIVFVEVLNWRAKKEVTLPNAVRDVATLFCVSVLLLYASALLEVAIQTLYR